MGRCACYCTRRWGFGFVLMACGGRRRNSKLRDGVGAEWGREVEDKRDRCLWRNGETFGGRAGRDRERGKGYGTAIK